MEKLFKLFCTLGVFLTLVYHVTPNADGEYNVGVGIADVTGPAAEIGMMGYASPDQSARGIHTRLFARSFIFQSGNGEPVVFLSADIGMVDQGIKYKVVEKLQEKYGEELFHARNVLLSGTHTHSGPGAFIQYLMYGITSMGFYKPSFDAIVEGMVESIQRAYQSMQPGKLYISKGIVEGANINRSPSSYLANPQEERDEYDGDTDKEMTLLRIESAAGKPLGVLNWFPVHPTSMNNTNRLLSGDNKGYASMLFEYEMNPNDRPGKGDFVAAFASSNLGDVSPNTKGPRCIDTGEPCDLVTSTCNGYVQKCIAFGPGDNMEESTEIIGKKQFDVARALFEDKDNAEMIKGDVNHIHQYVDMTNQEVIVNGTTKNTCKGALGYSFAAGTTDGPGMFDFKQGETTGNMFWDTIRDFLKKPSQEIEECHKPKPILLPVGEADFPYDWIASIVETQILRVGNLYILGIPGELTTMSGRRLRKDVEAVIKRTQPDGPDPIVVIAGLSNVYTHYIATYEEYQEQRYEAASTLYGPYTLNAYQQQYSLLAENLLSGSNLGAGPLPPDLLSRQWSLIAPIVYDSPPLLQKFGSVLVEPVPEVNPGETVTVRFAGGHPRHSTMRGGTFLLVERDVGEPRWEVVATDADWSTKFRWYRPNFLSSQSVIEITWKVPENVKPGFYRIRHFGYSKPAYRSTPRSYEGETSIFKVTGPGSEFMFHAKWNAQHKKPSTILSPAKFWNVLASVVKKN